MKRIKTLILMMAATVAVQAQQISLAEPDQVYQTGEPIAINYSGATPGSQILLYKNLALLPLIEGADLTQTDGTYTIPGTLHPSIYTARLVAADSTVVSELCFTVANEVLPTGGKKIFVISDPHVFNPDLVEKPRVLAITKCDLIDEELKDMLRDGLPSDVPIVFISSVAQQGLTELKDILWRTINDEHNRIPDTVALHDLDAQHRVQEEDDFIFAAQDPDYDEMPDAGGKMIVDEQDWDDEYWEDKFKDQNQDFQIVNDEE